MRISIVPAQITTVEDKIAGNISVQQAILLGIPILLGFILALGFPPTGQLAGYKSISLLIIFLICGSLAIRIKERIVGEWLRLFITYSLRPLYFIYDKNTTYLRPIVEMPKEYTTIEVKENQKPLQFPLSSLSIKERTRLEQLVEDAGSNVTFEVDRKGGLHVRITQTK
jgi:hypothetical protein